MLPPDGELTRVVVVVIVILGLVHLELARGGRQAIHHHTSILPLVIGWRSGEE